MPSIRERDRVTDTDTIIATGLAKLTGSRRLFLKTVAILAAGATAALTNPQAIFSSRPENPFAKNAEADAKEEEEDAAGAFAQKSMSDQLEDHEERITTLEDS